MRTLTGGPGRQAGILGVGGYRPERVVTTGAVADRLGVSAEWAISRTGMRQRHRAGEEETLAMMATAAALRALTAAGRRGTDVDCVLVATITNPTPTPAIAPQVAYSLGTPAAGFDVNSACAGFCHALELARVLIAAGSADCVVVVGADRMLDIVDPDDRNTAALFGDGAGAVVVAAAPQCGISPVVWGSDGAKAAALEVRPSSFAFAATPSLGRPWLQMDGTAVARWVAATVPAAVEAALRRAGVCWQDVAAFIPHQAGGRVIDRVVGQLDLPEHVVVADDLRTTANTSAASVPLALASLIEAGRVHRGELAVLMGFGAGLAYAGQVVRIP
ncbi:3-oxoacyl-(acyl-carrier-protein) synthase III [Allocatelliglobosispora scoriae]|uniref:3-oxoacyl-(Acyl-carrier-protein) synthase III n=1 Tax=Allocatelliglobosispora scoriae TaxID=643052 RepID=A0A841BGB5_9ACTN|nr:beta-ketoacyl-ACP synthase 3 [Allocatelliglobosispora scoriae]MBB5867324.1 3-oxoacyl-(acyl-carrier-protein) synthase III [Allocatelliglobosispora scoriae]